MIFFDDDIYNIKDVSELGVISIHTPDGVTEDALKKGLD
jgi:hypothetical protein